MHAICITLRALAGREEELFAVSRAVVAPSRAEPGCLFFDVLRSTSDPAELVFYEAYRAREDLDAHLAAEHTKAWQAAAMPMIDRASVRFPSHVSVA